MAIVNKKIIWLSACILLIFLIGGSILFYVKTTSTPGLLKINGVDVTRENVTIHYNYASLPLTEVMKGLGAKLIWVDDSTAELTYNEKKYILSLADSTLIEDGRDFNILIVPPGGKKRTLTISEKELIVDDGILLSVFSHLDIDARIRIDYDNQIVYIQ